MYGMTMSSVVQFHLVGRYVRELIDVLSGAYADISLHLLHSLKIVSCPSLDLLRGRIDEERAQDGTILDLNERTAAQLGYFFDEALKQFSLGTDHLDEHVVSGLDIHGVTGYIGCKFLYTRVTHGINLLLHQ
jgi:hypothetical protein